MKLKKILEEAGKALGIAPQKDCGKDVICMIDKLKDRKKKIHHKLAKKDLTSEESESLKEDEEIIKNLIKKAQKKLSKIDKEKKE